RRSKAFCKPALVSLCSPTSNPFPLQNMRGKLALLKKLLPADELSFEEAVLAENSGDKWFASHEPEAVAFPRSTRSVATLLKFANRHKIPVTARGAGHGYVGGCVPLRGGIVLSLARM